VAIHGNPFDEIMIVNPISGRGERRMKLYPIRESAVDGCLAGEPGTLGYIAEGPYEVAYMPEELGYVADPPPGFTEGFGYAPDGMAYVAEAPMYAGAPSMGYVSAAPGTDGYFGAGRPCGMGQDEQMMGYVSEAPETMGYFAEEPAEMGYFAEDPNDMGYFAEADEMGYVADEPEQMGYYAGEPGEMGEDEIGYFAEGPDGMEGYIRETTEPKFSPRVVPTEKLSGVEGYIQPRMINPTCESIRPADVVLKPASTWFKPLW
jgi:hypothetical protein